jgi:hypothetical protein
MSLTSPRLILNENVILMNMAPRSLKHYLQIWKSQ